MYVRVTLALAFLLLVGCGKDNPAPQVNNYPVGQQPGTVYPGTSGAYQQPGGPNVVYGPNGVPIPTNGAYPPGAVPMNNGGVYNGYAGYNGGVYNGYAGYNGGGYGGGVQVAWPTGGVQVGWGGSGGCYTCGYW